MRVEMVSRFRSAKENKAVIEDVARGKVDIVIGTHRLLPSDVQFPRLGLLIIDEEHRFGVADKERIKKLRKLVDVLTLTATPIPRTLHMAMLGHPRSLGDSDARRPIGRRFAPSSRISTTALIRDVDPARAQSRRPGLLRPQSRREHRVHGAAICARWCPRRTSRSRTAR